MLAQLLNHKCPPFNEFQNSSTKSEWTGSVMEGGALFCGETAPREYYLASDLM